MNPESSAGRPAPEAAKSGAASTPLQLASTYVTRGWSVVPVPYRTKRPVLDEWQKLRLSPEELQKHFDGAPQNVGVLLGAPSGGLNDVDLDSAQAVALADWFLPPTSSVFGRDSKLKSHRIYSCPLINRTQQYRAPDGTMIVELRSTGSQTVFPGSTHESGEAIEWHDDGAPTPVSAAVLAVAVGRLAAAALLARHWPAKGARHDAALALAGGLIRGGFDRANAEHFIKAVATAAGDDEIEDRVKAVQATEARLKSAEEDPEAKATGWPKLEELVGREIVALVRKWLLISSASEDAAPAEWDPPVPLGRFDLPEFPLEAIPDALQVLRRFFESVARSYQVPVDLVAVLGLTVGASALAKVIEVHAEGDWIEPVNMFVVGAMEPGERKSAVFRAVTMPLVVFEREENERLAPSVERNRLEREIIGKAIENAKTAAAKATKQEDRAAAMTRASELLNQLQQTPVIRPIRRIADEATSEALGRLLYDNDGRMAVLSPEGGVFDLMAGRYSANSMPNFSVYLKGHAGDDLRVDRVSKDRPPEYVDRPALSVGLAVQPQVLRGLSAIPEFRGLGLLGRFFYSIPRSKVGGRELSPAPVPEPVRRDYESLIHVALHLQPDVGSNGEPRPWSIHPSAEANAALRTFRAFVESSLRDDGDLAALRDWGTKLPGLVCRIAGVFHGLIHATSGNPGAVPIDEETMQCAIAIGQYAIPHARAAFFEMGANPAIGIARRIIDWIVSRGLKSFAKRDAFNHLRGTVHQVNALEEPLRLLMEHEFIRVRPVHRPGRGRKPSIEYDVNPKIDAHNAQNTHNSGGETNSAHCAHSAPKGSP